MALPMEKNKELIIDWRKIRRKREKKDVIIKASKHHQVCRGYILKEKENSTLTPQKFDVGTHFVREELITLVAEPGSN